ncbi:MAG: hypothetical protein NC078_05650 [Ruminococcus sp.]|nr:hypothetical protein [Ruminococcus sp.]
MEIYRDYNRFKSACSGFEELFNENRLHSGNLFCHPLIEGLIYVPCAPEETKSHSLDICRMSDMMLMSSDGEEFVPFNLAEARKIAEENECVYLADMNGQGAFEARSWMIDGKHDTLIISEEHMKKEGKPYAPVTPLTNVFLNFKKINCNFLYKRGTVDEPVVLSDKGVTEQLDRYINEALEEFPRIEVLGSAEFDIYGEKLVTDKNESRCMELDKGLAVLDRINADMTANESAFKAAELDVDTAKLTVKAAVLAADKCGVKMQESDFAGAADVNAVKDSLRKIISEKNTYGFKYTFPDKAKAGEALRAIELSNASPEEIKKDIINLLTVRPVYGSVFNLARAASPADAENVENISEYWQSSALDIAKLNEYLSENYIPADCRDSGGKLCCPGSKASVIMDEISLAAAKYKLKNAAVLSELSAYCEEFEKQSRTYNGTVFDTAEEMEKAVKNEKKLVDLCADLSALNEEELKKLRKYIYDMNLDKKTAGKYLLKIKLALNDCEVNQLKMLTTGLTLKKPDELSALKDKLKNGGFDETVAAPYISMVDEGILAASLKELTEMFKSIPDKAKADELEQTLASGRYDSMFKKHFAAKISDARDNFARTEISLLFKDIDSADRKTAGEIKAKLEEMKCRAALKAPYFAKLMARAEAAEREEAEKVFAGLKTADKAKLEELRRETEKFSKAISDKYTALINERAAELENEEFIKRCDGIPAMDRSTLAVITADLKSGKYPESISSKYLPMVDEREKAITKSELAEMCKDIPTMTFAKLEELEKKLADGKYTEELTAGFKENINNRRKDLYKEEADGLCKDIPTMYKPALSQLAEKLKDEKYPADYVKKYFEQIEKRVDEIENEKLSSYCKELEKKNKEELEHLSQVISAWEMKKENVTPWLEKIRQREIELMRSEMENLCKNIDNTPRKELSKLKEALSEGFDKEMAAKYIEQIDKRTQMLIKKELEDLCRNLSNAPKDKLLEMKISINEVPEYAEAGKIYIEQIDSRLKQIEKAEFDKQMADIDNLDREKLEKFMEDLEKRKPAFDPKRYEETLKKCNERSAFLDKQELDKICADIDSADLKALGEMKEKITEGGFASESAYPYLKKVDDAVTDRHVKYYSKLLANVGSMTRADLIVLLEKVKKNENNCPEDMLQRYVGQVKKKIREADCAFLDSKCKNLSSFSERRSLNLIKDIKAMDMDENDRSRFINQVELHITHLKTITRDGYVERFNAAKNESSVPKGSFYVSGDASFENELIKVSGTFASLEKFELPILIHEKVAGKAEEAFMLTVNYLYAQGSFGLVRIPLEKIERFESKSGLFGGGNLKVVDKDGKSSDILVKSPDKKFAENAPKVLNLILSVIQKDKADAVLREAEEIKAAEEAKLQEQEIAERELEAARKRALEAEKTEKEDAEKSVSKPAEAAKAEDKAPDGKSDDKSAAKTEAAKPPMSAPADSKAPIKPIKPIEVVVSPIPEVKPLPHIDAAKGEPVKPIPVAPAAAKETPKAEESAKPAEAPKAVEGVKPITPVTPIKPVETPKPAAAVKPAEGVKPIAPVKPIEGVKPAAPQVKPIEAVKPITPVKPIEGVKPVTPIKPIDGVKPAVKPGEPPKPVDAPKPAEAKPVMKVKFCDQCGAKITSDSAKFCAECGNKLIH